jgi:preprotein translocase subunit SecG
VRSTYRRTDSNREAPEVITGIVIALHVILSGLLVMFILMHRGSGGGLADVFGGGVGGGGGSAVVEKNLDRLTILVAVSFGITNVALVILL